MKKEKNQKKTNKQESVVLQCQEPFVCNILLALRYDEGMVLCYKSNSLVLTVKLLIRVN